MKLSQELIIAELEKRAHELEKRSSDLAYKVKTRDGELVLKNKEFANSMRATAIEYEEQLELANKSLTDKTEALSRVTAKLQDSDNRCSEQKQSILALQDELHRVRKDLTESKLSSQTDMDEVAALKCQLETEQSKARELSERSRNIDKRYKAGDLVSFAIDACLTEG